jgi:hypothetical protein
MSVTNQWEGFFVSTTWTTVKKTLDMNAKLLYENGEPLVIIPENSTEEFNRYVHGFRFSCSIKHRAFCEDSVFEFLEGEDTLRLKAAVEKFRLD